MATPTIAVRVHIEVTRTGRALVWAARRIAAVDERGRRWARPAAALLLWCTHRIRPGLLVRTSTVP